MQDDFTSIAASAGADTPDTVSVEDLMHIFERLGLDLSEHDAEEMISLAALGNVGMTVDFETLTKFVRTLSFRPPVDLSSSSKF